MSSYTNIEHKAALEDTLYWRTAVPDTSQKEYEYGRYLERLKDYGEAVKWYGVASEKDFMPAMYAYALCIKKRLGGQRDFSQVDTMLTEIFTYYRDKADTPEDFYRLGILYKYGWGTEKSEIRAFENFTEAAQHNWGEALYELALFNIAGADGYSKNLSLARRYLRKAYDAHCEEAIFKDFEVFQGEFFEYEYQREIVEAYSYRLGQYIRVAELRQTKESYQHVLDMYENGFPGDTGEKRESFIRKGNKYKKLLLSVTEF